MNGFGSAILAWMRRSVVRWLLLPLGLGLALAGLVTMGYWTREQIHAWDRYTIHFGDIDCTPPPGSKRADFLAEVQYLSELPSQLRLLDDDLPARLAKAFACHPWVERVERVAIVPPRQVIVQLIYRTPVLEVWMPRGENGGYLVQVDAQGIRLGAAAPSQDLPIYELGGGRFGTGGASAPDEPAVKAAARTAGFLRPYQHRLHIQRIGGTADRLILRGPWAAKVLWGRPPGAEAKDEASATQKLHRLLRYCATGGKKRSAPLDLRPKGAADEPTSEPSDKKAPP